MLEDDDDDDLITMTTLYSMKSHWAEGKSAKEEIIDISKRFNICVLNLL